MFTRFEVPFTQRAVTLRHGRPEEAFGPGRHWVFGRVELLRYDCTSILMDAPQDVRAIMPASWFVEFSVGADERAVVYRDDVPELFLRPGVYRRWTMDSSVRVERFDARLPLVEPTTELMSVIPKGELSFQVIAEYERALLFVAGRLERELEPGLYTFWTRAAAPVAVEKFDLRTQLTTVSGQDLMTRDKVTLRLTLTVEYRVADVRLAVMSRKTIEDAMYLQVQLAARSFVANVKLDELLESRTAFEEFLMTAVRANAEAFGVALERVGVKDIVLPGDMKLLLNRVIEAEKEAAAKVILRREEVSAMKSLATSAKALVDSPGAMRLKELEALAEMASRVGELRLVVGANGLPGMEQLMSLGDKTE